MRAVLAIMVHAMIHVQILMVDTILIFQEGFMDMILCLKAIMKHGIIA